MRISRTATTSARRFSAHAGGNPLIQIGLLVFGLLVVVAIVTDLVVIQKPHANVSVRTELQDLLLGLNGPRYVSRSGLFSLVPPTGWQITEKPACPPYDVTFRGPYATEISVMATPVAYDDLPSLLKDIDRTELQFDIHTQKEPLFFQAKPAVRRVVRMNRGDLFSLDFVRDRVAHHVLCKVPSGQLDSYFPAIMEVMNTYQCGAPAGSNAVKAVAP